MKRAALLAVVVAVCAAGCGSSRPQAASSNAVGGAVAFSRCMRAHGIRQFPDPSVSGRIPKVALAQLGVGSARFASAQSACRHFLPAPTAAQTRSVAAESLEFSRCVRAHGVPSFPDPGSSGRIPDPAAVGIDQGSPRFEAANTACGRYRPPYMPSNSAYNAYAKSHGQ